MTQQELADHIFVTRQTINAIEGDKYSPSLEVAFRIAHVFGVPLEQVFQYEPPTAAERNASYRRCTRLLQSQFGLERDKCRDFQQLERVTERRW